MSVEPAVQTDPLAEYHLRFIEAVKAGDIPTIVSFYTETAVVMPPNDTSLFGKKEWRSGIRNISRISELKRLLKSSVK